ncbi:MAG TPA: lysine--tRNA ligase [Mycobacteriales bacterium]|nr:lysine--tRNA ligase [Mycobacteriales bacterium]
MRVRREKLERLQAAGIEAYPVKVARTHSLAEVREENPDLPADTNTGKNVGVTGRVIFIRNTGKLCFATLREGNAELQAMLSLSQVGEEALAAWKSDVDLGDHVFVEGEVITSKRGELSVLADSWQLTAKSLRPLPVAHKPMGEETRVRQRYVDLIMRPEARRMVEMRSAVRAALRGHLIDQGFLEVETPIVQSVQGGATARPFASHFNAFDADVVMRIALELPLKRCVVGGIDKVFEMGPVLRNEGADWTHNPEFTMLEVYQAYSDYDQIADLTRDLYQVAARAVFGSTVATHFDGTTIDLGGDWERLSLYDLVSEALGETITPETPLDVLQAHAERHGIAVNPAWVAGKVLEEIFEELCEDRLEGPVFIRDFPLDTSPLTRRHRTRPGVAEKWDLYIRKVEVATGYSELTDPIDQRRRLVEQSLAAAQGDVDAMQLDEDFLRALEYGMPPTGGMGLGIDRLMQVLTGRGLRETVLFPFVRPE